MASSRPPRATVGHGAPEPSSEPSGDRRWAAYAARVRSLVRAIEENDEAKVEEAILRLSRSRRVFAPLAFVISAFVMLFTGLRLLVSNWRLTLVQIIPAMWIWLAMFDLKAHTLHGKSFNVLRGPILIPIGLVDRHAHGGELLPQRRVRVRDLTTQTHQDSAGRGASAPALGADRELRSHHRGAARLLHHRRDPLGSALVHALAGDHRRRHDGQLRGRSRAADRREAQAVAARQAVNQRGRGDPERGHLHAAVHARKAGDPDARIQFLVHSRDLRARCSGSRCKPAQRGRSGR